MGPSFVVADLGVHRVAQLCCGSAPLEKFHVLNEIFRLQMVKTKNAHKQADYRSVKNNREYHLRFCSGRWNSVRRHSRIKQCQHGQLALNVSKKKIS